MKQGNKQKGFSVIIIVLSILVLAGLGLTGWYVWNKDRQNNATSNNRAPHTQQKSDVKDDVQTDQSQAAQYLVIQEWGVRFMLPEELRNNIEYGIFTFNNGDQAAYFVSKKIVSQSPHGTCSLTPTNDSAGQGVFGGTIALSRSTSKPEEIDQRSFNKDGFWYTIEASNGGPCYEGDTGEEKGSFNTLVDAAVRELETIR